MKSPRASFEMLRTQVLGAYPTVPEKNLDGELVRIAAVCRETRDLVGKNVLDLGCGSEKNLDEQSKFFRWLAKYGIVKKSQEFSPWYCRIMHLAGANVIGIDIEDNTDEPFASYTLDLLDPAALSQFPDASFDIVNNYYFTQPSDSGFPCGISPQVMRSLNMDFDAAFEIDERIRCEVQRLLAKGGKYTHAEFLEQKKSGSLRRVGHVGHHVHPAFL